MIAELLQYIYSLKNYASRLLNNNIHDAEDAVQDLSIRLWNKKELLESLPLNDQKKYACTALFNICTDYHRRFDASNSPRKNGHAEQLIPSMVGFDVNVLEIKENQTILHNAISKMKNKDRKLMLVMFFDGYKYKEIAKILRTSIINVTAGIHGAKSSIMKSIKNYNYDNIQKSS